MESINAVKNVLPHRFNGNGGSVSQITGLFPKSADDFQNHRVISQITGLFPKPSDDFRNIGLFPKPSDDFQNQSPYFRNRRLISEITALFPKSPARFLRESLVCVCFSDHSEKKRLYRLTGPRLVPIQGMCLDNLGLLFQVRGFPKHVAGTRELRDRYLEQFNDPSNGGLVLPGGKYELSRQISGRIEQPPQLLLEG